MITQEQIDAYIAKYPDNSREAAEGTLALWEKGQGELDAELVNGSEVFAPIVEAYYKANGEEVPESVKVPLTPVNEGVTDVMGEQNEPFTPSENSAQ